MVRLPLWSRRLPLKSKPLLSGRFTDLDQVVNWKFTSCHCPKGGYGLASRCEKQMNKLFYEAIAALIRRVGFRVGKASNDEIVLDRDCRFL